MVKRRGSAIAPLKFTPNHLKRHVYVLGQSGTGKSRFLADLTVKLIKRDTGVALIDPHDTFYSLIVDHAAWRGQRKWDDIVLFDPLDEDYIVGFNPLELLPGEVAERKAQNLATIIAKVFQDDPRITGRMNWLMTNMFWLLIDNNLTLAEFQMILTNRQLRDKLLEKYPQQHGLRLYWQGEFPSNERLVAEWTQSSLNRIGAMLLDPAVKLIFGQQKSTINFLDLMNTGKVLLASLGKGLIGAQNSYLIGAFLMAQIQAAAMARARQSYRKQFVLVVDEFQNYLTDEIDDILSESRKYELALVMAHQYFDQLVKIPQLQSAVLGTTGNFICFRTGRQDAELHAKNMFSPPIDQLKDVKIQAIPTGWDMVPYRYEDDYVWRPLEEIWEMEYRQLTELPDRYFWYKHKGMPGSKLLVTEDFPDVQRTPQLERSRRALIQRSARNYGMPKPQVRAAIQKRHQGMYQMIEEQKSEANEPESY